MKQNLLRGFCLLAVLSLVLSACEKNAEPAETKLNLEVSFGEIGTNSIHYSVKPSSNDQSYYANLFEAAEIDGKDDTQLLDYAKQSANFAEKIYTGQKDLQAQDLKDGTGYRVLYFGYDPKAANELTTEIFKSETVRTTQEKQAFQLEIGEITSNSLQFTITPSLMEEKYFAGLYPATEIAGKSGEALFQYVTTTEQFSTNIFNGTTEKIYEELTPETAYHIVYFGYDEESKAATTEILMSDPVKTLEQATAFTFEVSDITQTSATYKIIPNKEITYIFGMIEWATFETEYESDLEMLLAHDLEWYEFLAETYGGKWTDYIEQDMKTGETSMDTKDLETGQFLRWNRKYMIYAYGINTDGTITDPIEYYTYETLPLESVDMTFDVTINEIFSNGVNASILPSLKDKGYFVSIQRANYVDWWMDPANGVTEDDMLFELIGGRFPDIDDYVFTGDATITPEMYYLSRPNKDHYMIIVGYDNGPTTKATLVKFTTAPAEE